MSNSPRPHRHKCPRCGLEEWCGNYQCYRTGFQHERLCGGGKSCRQEREREHEVQRKLAERARDEMKRQMEMF